MKLSNNHKTARKEVWIAHVYDVLAEKRSKGKAITDYDLNYVLLSSDKILLEFDERFMEEEEKKHIEPFKNIDILTGADLDILGDGIKVKRNGAPDVLYRHRIRLELSRSNWEETPKFSLGDKVRHGNVSVDSASGDMKDIFLGPSEVFIKDLIPARGKDPAKCVVECSRHGVYIVREYFLMPISKEDGIENRKCESSYIDKNDVAEDPRR